MLCYFRPHFNGTWNTCKRMQSSNVLWMLLHCPASHVIARVNCWKVDSSPVAVPRNCVPMHFNLLVPICHKLGLQNGFKFVRIISTISRWSPLHPSWSLSLLGQVWVCWQRWRRGGRGSQIAWSLLTSRGCKWRYVRACSIHVYIPRQIRQKRQKNVYTIEEQSMFEISYTCVHFPFHKY